MAEKVLITGASSGIGLELAHVFARDGYEPVLIARSEDKLRELATEINEKYGVEAHVLVQDLTDPGAPRRIFHWTQNEQLNIEVVVNSAGFGAYGLFVDTPLDEEVDMIQVNVSALSALTKLFLPYMKEKNRGGILNVASTAAFQPGPLMSVYFATKAYVLSFSEALANELRDTDVTVTALCPGPTKTGFDARASLEKSKLFDGLLQVMDAQTVAEAGYRGFQKGKNIVVPGVLNRIGVLSGRLLPRKVMTHVVRNIQRMKPSS